MARVPSQEGDNSVLPVVHKPPQTPPAGAHGLQGGLMGSTSRQATAACLQRSSLLPPALQAVHSKMASRPWPHRGRRPPQAPAQPPASCLAAAPALQRVGVAARDPQIVHAQRGGWAPASAAAAAALATGLRPLLTHDAPFAASLAAPWRVESVASCLPRAVHAQWPPPRCRRGCACHAPASA